MPQKHMPLNKFVVQCLLKAWHFIITTRRLSMVLVSGQIIPAEVSE